MTPRSTSSDRTRLSTRLVITSFSTKVTRGLISRKAAIASGRTPAATDGRAAIRTTPYRLAARSRLSITTVSSSRKSLWNTGASSRPTRVSSTVRELRSSNLTASASSRRLIWTVKAGWDRCNRLVGHLVRSLVLCGPVSCREVDHVAATNESVARLECGGADGVDAVEPVAAHACGSGRAGGGVAGG